MRRLHRGAAKPPVSYSYVASPVLGNAGASADTGKHGPDPTTIVIDEAAERVNCSEVHDPTAEYNTLNEPLQPPRPGPTDNVYAHTTANTADYDVSDWARKQPAKPIQSASDNVYASAIANTADYDVSDWARKQPSTPLQGASDNVYAHTTANTADYDVSDWARKQPSTPLQGINEDNVYALTDKSMAHNVRDLPGCLEKIDDPTTNTENV